MKLLISEILKNQWVIGIGVTVIGGLVLYYLFGIGKKNYTKSKKDEKEPFSFKVAEEEVTIEEKMISLQMDVLKINAHDHFLGVQAEYLWINKNYPGNKTLNQSLREYSFDTKNSEKRVITFDVINIELASGRHKEIYFEIESFFNKNKASSIDTGYAEQKLHDIYSDLEKK
ncbi:MAG: hypothetical protein KBB86_01060 [Candidatus Pacebacteria bacterium]|nr:hypothetical protein [Candidatus Paceibacterota bacterium]